MSRWIAIFALAVLVSACTPAYQNPNLPRPVKGGENAVVVVDEFGDFQCPACGQAYPVVKALQEQYGDRVLWKYYHFPLIQIHPYAFNASMAAECALDQGKFWEMHDLLFENQTKLARSDLYGYADQLGLNAELFDACFKSRAKSDQIRSDMAEAERRGVNATPSFYVNGQLIQNWSALGSAIEALLTPAVPAPAEE